MYVVSCFPQESQHFSHFFPLPFFSVSLYPYFSPVYSFYTHLRYAYLRLFSLFLLLLIRLDSAVLTSLLSQGLSIPFTFPSQAPHPPPPPPLPQSPSRTGTLHPLSCISWPRMPLVFSLAGHRPSLPRPPPLFPRVPQALILSHSRN